MISRRSFMGCLAGLASASCSELSLRSALTSSGFDPFNYMHVYPGGVTVLSTAKHLDDASEVFQAAIKISAGNPVFLEPGVFKLCSAISIK